MSKFIFNFGARKISLTFFVLFFSTALFSQITVNSSTGTTTPTTYTTLKASFDAINAGTHTGVILISVTGNTTESNSCVLNASGTGSSNYSSIKITPSGGSARVVSGAITSGLPLIDLNGADNVTINGLAINGDSLSIVNTTSSSTTGTSTIRFIAGATNNLVTNCSILGSTISTSSGVVFFSTDASTGGSGNDLNKIRNNIISNATAIAPKYGVYSAGTTAKENSQNSIDSNFIFNFHTSTGAAGVYFTSNTTNCSVSNNHFYQTTNRSVSGSYYGIYLSNTSGFFQVLNNYIGGTSPYCAGLPTKLSGSVILQAIYIASSASAISSIQGNRISNIEISTTSTSIVQALLYAQAGKLFIGNVIGNVFGDDLINASINYTSTPSSTTFSVIGYGTGTFDTVLVKNNMMAGITLAGNGGMSLRCIDITGSTAKNIIDGNIFGSLNTANSLNNSTTNSLLAVINRGTTANFVHQIINNKFVNFYCLKGNIRAISTGSATTWNVSNNEIYNFINSSVTSSTGANAITIAINSISTGPLNQIISNNKIYKLYNDAITSTTVTAIFCANATTGGTNRVDRNLIHSLNTAATQGSTINGIEANSGGYIYSNNMIRLGIDENGVAMTNASNINGIQEVAGTNNFYFNTLYIGGAGVASVAEKTAAFNSIATAGTRNVINNIFANNRTNATGLASHYAFSTATATGLSFRNNDYWNANGFLSRHISADVTSIANYRLLFPLDTFSVNVDPNFINADAASFDLHISNSSVPTSLESGGKIVLVNSSPLNYDYDNNLRPGPFNSTLGGGSMPDIGADEFDGIPFIACATPIAGDAISSDTVSCNGATVQLSLSGSSTVGNTNNYQWEKSTNGINYSNVANANASSVNVFGIATNTYFRCKITCTIGQTSSISNPCLVVYRNTSITSIVNDTLCGPGIATLTVSASNGIINWYENLTSTVPIATGNQLITPNLTAAKTYYAEAVYQNCKSSKVSVNVIFNTLPIITFVQNDSICQGGIITLTVASDKGQIKWYESAASSLPLFTGSVFNTPFITASQTYYVEPVSGNCVGLRVPVQAKVISPPSIVQTSSKLDSVCGSKALKIFAKADKGTIKWFASMNGITPFANTDTITLNINSDTTVYAEAMAGKCSSTRVAFVFKSNRIPVIDSIFGAAACAGNTLQLRAVSSSGVINWHSSLQGNNSLATGNIFNTPILDSTLKYYVESSSKGCKSNRLEVVATIFAKPNPSISRKLDTLLVDKKYDSYSWYKDNIILPGAYAAFLKLTSSGKYKVYVTDNRTCTAYSNEITYNVNGIDLINAYDIKVYPNPFSTELIIENIVAANIEFTDMQGRLIKRLAFANRISLQEILPGIYFIRLLDENNKLIAVQKVVKIEQ
jgi:hypothetical protein